MSDGVTGRCCFRIVITESETAVNNKSGPWRAGTRRKERGGKDHMRRTFGKILRKGWNLTSQPEGSASIRRKVPRCSQEIGWGEWSQRMISGRGLLLVLVHLSRESKGAGMQSGTGVAGRLNLDLCKDLNWCTHSDCGLRCCLSSDDNECILRNIKRS